MVQRFLLLFAFLAAPSVCHSADSVSVRIRHFGIEGSFSERGGPTWVQLELHNRTAQSLDLQLIVAELDLEDEARPRTGIFRVPVLLAAAQQRILDLPIPIVKLDRGVLFIEAKDASGLPLAHAARLVGKPSEGKILALLCAHAELCRSIQQAILLTGTAEEQTRKSQSLRVLLLSEPAPVWWAYSDADTVVLATPLAHLSARGRDALEGYLHHGGRLVLVEDQVASPLQQGAASAFPFLTPYRQGPPTGKVIPVGAGKLFRVKSVSSSDFSDFFRTFGFGEYTPPEVRQLRDRFLGLALHWADGNDKDWLVKRLSTNFHFPRFFVLLSWMASYLLLVGLFNFVFLRRIGRPEWGWVTIPVIALSFSILLYVVSARQAPRSFGLDEIAVYSMDGISSVATSNVSVRISAPKRSVAAPVLPGDLIHVAEQTFWFGEDVHVNQPFDLFTSVVQLGDTWETEFPLRKWSYRDLEFEGVRRFAGVVAREGSKTLTNGTGIRFQQALFVDHDSAYSLGPFAPGASVDLSRVPQHTYQQMVGRSARAGEAYPGPPFEIRDKTREDQELREAPLDEKQFEKEWQELSQQTFTLTELIRGWPRDADSVFTETKAVFFGLSTEASPGARLRGMSPLRKAYSLVIVTFRD